MFSTRAFDFYANISAFYFHSGKDMSLSQLTPIKWMHTQIILILNKTGTHEPNNRGHF